MTRERGVLVRVPVYDVTQGAKVCAGQQEYKTGAKLALMLALFMPFGLQYA